MQKAMSGQRRTWQSKCFSANCSRFLVADQQHEILVTSDDPCALIRALLRLVVDGLGKLDDLTFGKPLEHALAEILMRPPKIAEIAAAMDEDRSRRHDALKLLGREIIHA